MVPYQIVIDTNVLVSALRSRLGASFKLLRLVQHTKFKINISVSLMMEYEDATNRLIGKIPLSKQDINSVLDYLASIANRRKIFYLWRPTLKDPKDDMVLELAISAKSDFIITYNKRDFRGIEKFGIQILTPKEFLHKIGELS